MSSYLDFGIFLYLANGKTYTAEYLASKFEVCKKTIYRHVNNLVFAGVPITTTYGKTGGIKLTNKTTYNLSNLSVTEVNYLRQLLCNNTNHTNNTAKIINAKLTNFLSSVNTHT